MPDTTGPEFGRIEVLGLAGVSIVCVTQILTLDHLDVALVTALACFSAATPLLAVVGFMFKSVIRGRRPHNTLMGLLFSLMSIASCLAVGGVTAVFWHFHWALGVVFLTSTLLSIACLLCFEDVFEKFTDEPKPDYSESQKT